MRHIKEFINGLEYPSDVPIEVPLGFKKPLTLEERLKRYVRQELGRQASDAGFESFEEADDFDVDEDPDFQSPYEMTEMQEDGPMQDPEPPPAPRKAGEDGGTGKAPPPEKPAAETPPAQ